METLVCRGPWVMKVRILMRMCQDSAYLRVHMLVHGACCYIIYSGPQMAHYLSFQGTG